MTDKTLEQTYDYTQKSEENADIRELFTKSNSLTDFLQNIHVFIYEHPNGNGWLISPITVKKQPRKIMKLFTIGEQIMIDAKDIMSFKTRQVSYDVFKQNLEISINNMEKGFIPWFATNSGAVAEANTVNYWITKIVKEANLGAPTNVRVGSLYEIMQTITPNLNDYIKHFDDLTKLNEK